MFSVSLLFYINYVSTYMRIFFMIVLSYHLQRSIADNVSGIKEARVGLKDSLLCHVRFSGHSPYNPICFTSINTSAMYFDNLCALAPRYLFITVSAAFHSLMLFGPDTLSSPVKYTKTK